MGKVLVKMPTGEITEEGTEFFSWGNIFKRKFAERVKKRTVNK